MPFVPILESKSMGAIFQKQGKIFENLRKNVKTLKIFWKMARDCLRYLHAINCWNRPCFVNIYWSRILNFMNVIILKSPWNFFQQKLKKHYDLWKSSKKCFSWILNSSFDKRYGLRWFVSIDRNNLDSVE